MVYHTGCIVLPKACIDLPMVRPMGNRVGLVIPHENFHGVHCGTRRKPHWISWDVLRGASSTHEMHRAFHGTSLGMSHGTCHDASMFP